MHPLYVNKKRYKNYTLGESHCWEDTELLFPSFRPFYLPGESGQLFITVVSIHSRRNARAAADVMYDTVVWLENAAPDSLKFILWDFNGCSIKEHYPSHKR